jgi:hypothetical protein
VLLATGGRQNIGLRTQPVHDDDQPEVVLAAIAKSERLGQLNRHLCRPLDRLVTQAP